MSAADAVEPDVNGRSHQAWTLLGTMGFPAITVPAGFTTHVFDRVPETHHDEGQIGNGRARSESEPDERQPP